MTSFNSNQEWFKIYLETNIKLKVKIDYVNECKFQSKHLNLETIQFFLTRSKISIKFTPINSKWLIAMIGYNKLALRKYV